MAALRSDLEPLRMAAHALDDADHLGARLHDHLARAHRGVRARVRVRVRVRVG